MAGFLVSEHEAFLESRPRKEPGALIIGVGAHAWTPLEDPLSPTPKLSLPSEHPLLQWAWCLLGVCPEDSLIVRNPHQPRGSPAFKEGAAVERRREV